MDRKFKAIGYGLDQHSEKLIRSMAAIVTSEPIDITDLAVFDPEEIDSNIVFVFGEKARKEIEDKKPSIKLIFPDAIRLDGTFGEEEERLAAYEQLLKLKKLLVTVEHQETMAIESELGSRNTVTEDSLPAISSTDVLQYLERALRKEGIKEWLGSTKDGKLIRFTLDREEGKADINMTFAELYLLRLAMETLQVKEFDIVYKPGFNQQNGSYGSHSSNDR